MHKAIQLKVSLAITEPAPPPDSSVSAAEHAVRRLLSSGHWRHPRLHITIKNIVNDPSTASDQAEHVIAKLWIEGEDAPADDFAKLTTQAVRDIIAAGHLLHPFTHVAITSIAEDS